jgi:type IV pilus assembly protein PilB
MSGPHVRNEPVAPPRATQGLGNLLVGEGLITRERLAQAVAEQHRTGETLTAVLLKLALVDENSLIDILARHYGIPAVALSQLDLEPQVLALVPVSLATKYEVLPLTREHTTLTLAMADPTNVYAVDDVAFITNLHVAPVIASRTAIRQAIDRNYHRNRTTDAVADIINAAVELEPTEEGESRSGPDAFELKESADEPPIVRLVNTILIDAIERGASDIHWEPYEHLFRLRLRVDGILHERWTLPKRLEPGVISRLKIMSSMDIAERRLPQDGRIHLRYRHREADLRVSILPTSFGEKCVIRILDKETVRLDLRDLGFDGHALDVFHGALKQPYGMILITGPTGSGKTTTLYAGIQAINAPGVNIVTAEDPVEYNLKGVNQVQINEAIGRTFATVLRSFLRQDPDVMLVGETRDVETAQIAVRAALTGHLVLSTVHTNDCPATIARLVDMGLPAYLVSSCLLLIVAQRLARRVCEGCKEMFESDEDVLAAHGYAPTGRRRLNLARGKGCERCHFTGMKGRIALYELMPMTEAIRDMIVRGASAAELRAMAQSQGMKTLREAGIARVLEGTTTIDEMLRVTLV